MRALAIGWILLLIMAPAVHAQCVLDTPTQRAAASAVVEAYLDSIGGDGEVPVASLRAKLTEGSLPVFSAGASKHGSGVASCFLRRFPAFAAAALTELEAADDTISRSEAREHLTRAASVLVRGDADPLFSLFFGLGFAVVTDNDDVADYKIIRNSEADPDNTQTPSAFVVRESDSRGFPAIYTGVKVNLGRRHSLVPSSAFASAQFSRSGGEAFNGVVLGLGWSLIGESSFLLGFGLARYQTLRDDLLAEFNDLEAPRRLVISSFETEETILGTETANLFVLALAVPISLGSSLGGG